ncbi:MAG: hypothetical protein ACOCUS_01245, partial [Polyangiales bacterium]
LIPAWVIASAQARASNNATTWAEDDYERLRGELAADPNLAALFDELHLLLGTDPLSNADRIDYLLWAYNDYLDRNDQPWRVEATLYVRDQRPIFYTTSYRILSDVETEDGRRVRLVRRADPTNVVEGYLGHTQRAGDGAFVVMDRVLHFAARNVWPLMHPAIDDRRPREEGAFGPAIRDEALATLSPDLHGLLQETAVDQQALVEVAQSIHARRGCGNHFRVWGLPYKGLSSRDQRSLVGALLRSRESECPEVTLPEAARMVGASERLRHTDDIDAAIEELGAWVARGVAAHELRHVADDAGGGPDCDGCPQSMSEAAVAELSAYLSAFATPRAGRVALLQACALVGRDGGAHAEALAFAFERLLPDGCGGGPPEDVHARARELELELFGDREPVRLPERFPQSVAMMEPLQK